jgi:hypothetical protein
MKSIFRFAWGCECDDIFLNGLFLAEEEEVERACNKGWALRCRCEDEEDAESSVAHCIRKVTDDQEAVRAFQKYDLTVGFNPLTTRSFQWS